MSNECIGDTLSPNGRGWTSLAHDAQVWWITRGLSHYTIEVDSGAIGHNDEIYSARYQWYRNNLEGCFPPTHGAREEHGGSVSITPMFSGPELEHLATARKPQADEFVWWEDAFTRGWYTGHCEKAMRESLPGSIL